MTRDQLITTMKALRQLAQAVDINTAKSGQAKDVVDYCARRLGQIFEFDFKEGESVFEDRIPKPEVPALDFSILAPPPPKDDDWWTWAHKPEMMLSRTQMLRECLDNEDTIDPNDCQAAIELIYVLSGKQPEPAPGTEVYVMHIGLDCNYEIGGVFLNGDAAESAALATVQSIWDEAEKNGESFSIPRPETYADIEGWNALCENGDEQHVVKLHVAKLEN